MLRRWVETELPERAIRLAPMTSLGRTLRNHLGSTLLSGRKSLDQSLDQAARYSQEQRPASRFTRFFEGLP
jgi:hypothetical protein